MHFFPFHPGLRTGFILFLAFLLPVSFASESSAAIPPTDTNQQAGVLSEKILEEKKDTLEEITDFPAVEYEPEEGQESTLPQLEFKVQRILLKGNTIFTTEQLAPDIAPYENQMVTVTRLNELASKIETIYRAKGYITTYVYLPPQEVDDESVTIHVIEGKVGEIKSDGNRYFSDPYILKYSEVHKGEILYYDNIRRTIRSINRNPDLNVRVVLSAGDDFETTDVLFKVKDRYPIHFGASVTNEGTPAIGEENYGFTVRHNNATGNHDTLLLGTAFAKELGVAYAQYLIPIPEIDWKFVGGMSHAQVSPKKNLEPFGVNSASMTYSGRLQRNLYQTEYLLVDFDFGMDVKKSRTRVLSQSFRKEHLNILASGVNMTFINPDGKGNMRLHHEFSWGLPIWGAHVETVPEASRQGVEPDFFRYRVTFSGNRLLNFGGHRFEWQTRFQIPSNKLPSQEALYFGGASSIRGYPEGDMLADTGVVMRHDYFVPVWFLPANWRVPGQVKPLKDQLELVGFADYGHAEVRGPSALEVSRRDLAGVGAGLRYAISKDIWARFDWGFVVGDRALTEGGDSQFHFRFQYES